MTKKVEVLPWSADQFESFTYDAIFTTIGYERRARFIADQMKPHADRKIACAFSRQKGGSFKENQDWFKRAGYGVVESGDAEFGDTCRKLLDGIQPREERPIRLCVDISSMSRFRIAAMLRSIMELSGPASAVVDLTYAIARYNVPHREMSQIQSAEPVLPTFAGWSEEPERPATVIFGVGYEYDKAVGVLEYIEPSAVWAFQPISPDPLYDIEAERANQFLWQVLPRERRIQYHVDRPFDCFVNLESLTNGILRDSKPVLIPFGPKIFTACCLLVALVHRPNVAVWRVSSGEYETPVNREADGNVVGMRVKLEPISRA